MCFGGRQYTPQSPPITPLPVPTQWVGTPTSRPAEFWGPCPPSAVPPVDETPQGISPTRGSGTMYQNQTGALLAPPPHRTFPSFSYPLLPFPRSLPAIPIFPTPSRGSVPPPSNCRQWMKTFVPSTGINRPLSAVSHTPIRPVPSAPPSPSTTNLRHFHSTLRRNIAEVGCACLRDFCGTNM